jgi:serine/threonine protein kinase
VDEQSSNYTVENKDKETAKRLAKKKYRVKLNNGTEGPIGFTYDEMRWLHIFVNSEINNTNQFKFNDFIINPVNIYKGKIKGAGGFGLIYVFTTFDAKNPTFNKKISIAMKIIKINNMYAVRKRENNQMIGEIQNEIYNENTPLIYSETEILHELKKMDPESKVFIKYYGYIYNNKYISLDDPKHGLFIKLAQKLIVPKKLIINFAEAGQQNIFELWETNKYNQESVIETLLKLFTDYCQNLITYAKKYGKWFVHHDIKADNLLYINDNKIKIIDFGLSFFNENNGNNKGASAAFPKGNGFRFDTEIRGTTTHLYLFCFDEIPYELNPELFTDPNSPMYKMNSPLFDIASLALIILLTAKKIKSDDFNYETKQYQDPLMQAYFNLKKNNTTNTKLDPVDFSESIFGKYGKKLQKLNKLIYCVRYWNSRGCPHENFHWIKNKRFVPMKLDPVNDKTEDYYMRLINELVKII